VVAREEVFVAGWGKCQNQNHPIYHQWGDTPFFFLYFALPYLGLYADDGGANTFR
jgi:hypothetical protein